MRYFKHLLWITPLVIVVLFASLGVYAAATRSTDAAYHSKLEKTIHVSSRNFQGEQEIPLEFSCKGAGVSPQVRWTNPPDGAKSYVLIATDWDAPSPRLRLISFVHWVLYNIPGDATEIPQGALAVDLGQKKIGVGLNTGGQPGYTPPCPPLGAHRYEFRVYALDVDQIKPESNDKKGVMKAMDGHILGYGELVGMKAS